MPYATADDVQAYLGITNNGDEALIASLIDRAQAVIDKHTRRTFEADADTTQYMDAVADVHERTLMLPGDLAAITTVTNGDGSTVASSKYITEPRNGTPYWALTLKQNAGIAWTYTDAPENAISIAGRWAYSIEAPDDIMHATIRLTAWLYRQRSSQSDIDRPIMAAEGVILLPSALPNDILTILRPYRKLI